MEPCRSSWRVPCTEVTGPKPLTEVAALSSFVSRASWKQISPEARSALKIHVLDALGCALGGLNGEPVRLVRKQIELFGGNPLATMIGGGRSSPERAALFNGAAIRYLDFNDSYLAPGETCHPSDNVAPVLAAAEYAGATGADFLTALAVAYQVQCRLSDEAPVRDHGFDHVTQGAYAVAAGCSRALGLDAGRTANAIAIAGTALNALRVTRTGELSNWKGLAYPYAASCALTATFLAAEGVTGPNEVFEGNKGFKQAIAGQFEIDWESEDLERVRDCIVKRYNAEIHSQSVLEAILELKANHSFDPADVQTVEIDVFDVAYKIIGGGEEGDKRLIRTKEEADHSLPYLVAVALLDGQVLPVQYRPERIAKGDVQDLLKRVHIHPDPELSAEFPTAMPCRIRIHLSGGPVLSGSKSDYEGFKTRPATWEAVRAKLYQLGGSVTSSTRLESIARAVVGLDGLQVSELCAELADLTSNASRANSTRSLSGQRR